MDCVTVIGDLDTPTTAIVAATMTHGTDRGVVRGIQAGTTVAAGEDPLRTTAHGSTNTMVQATGTVITMEFTHLATTHLVDTTRTVGAVEPTTTVRPVAQSTAEHSDRVVRHTLAVTTATTIV